MRRNNPKMIFHKTCGKKVFSNFFRNKNFFKAVILNRKTFANHRLEKISTGNFYERSNGTILKFYKLHVGFLTNGNVDNPEPE